MTTIQFIVSTDQRKYSRTYKHDVTLYDVGKNGVPFINCNVTVTKHCWIQNNNKYRLPFTGTTRTSRKRRTKRHKGRQGIV